MTQSTTARFRLPAALLAIALLCAPGCNEKQESAPADDPRTTSLRNVTRQSAEKLLGRKLTPDEFDCIQVGMVAGRHSVSIRPPLADTLREKKREQLALPTPATQAAPSQPE